MASRSIRVLLVDDHALVRTGIRKILEGAKADIPTMIVGSDLTDAARKVTEAVGSAA